MERTTAALEIGAVSVFCCIFEIKVFVFDDIGFDKLKQNIDIIMYYDIYWILYF